MFLSRFVWVMPPRPISVPSLRAWRVSRCWALLARLIVAVRASVVVAMAASSGSSVCVPVAPAAMVLVGEAEAESKSGCCGLVVCEHTRFVQTLKRQHAPASQHMHAHTAGVLECAQARGAYRRGHGRWRAMQTVSQQALLCVVSKRGKQRT
jgi:hypothetical protein